MKLLLLLPLAFALGCSKSSSEPSGSGRGQISQKLTAEYDKICSWLNASRFKDGQVLVYSTHEIYNEAQRLNCDATVTLKGDCSKGDFALAFSRVQSEDHPRRYYSKANRSVTLNLSRSAKPVLKLTTRRSAEHHSIDKGKYRETISSESGNVEYSNFEFVDSGSLVLKIKLNGADGDRKDASQTFYEDMPDEKLREDLATFQFDSVLTFDTQSDLVSTQVSNLKKVGRKDPPSLQMNSIECRLPFD